MIASRAAENLPYSREARTLPSLASQRSWFSGRAGCLEQSAHHQALDLAALSAGRAPYPHPSVAIFSLRAMRSFKDGKEHRYWNIVANKRWFLIVPVGQVDCLPARNRLQPGVR